MHVWFTHNKIDVFWNIDAASQYDMVFKPFLCNKSHFAPAIYGYNHFHWNCIYSSTMFVIWICSFNVCLKCVLCAKLCQTVCQTVCFRGLWGAVFIKPEQWETCVLCGHSAKAAHVGSSDLPAAPPTPFSTQVAGPGCKFPARCRNQIVPFSLSLSSFSLFHSPPSLCLFLSLFSKYGQVLSRVCDDGLHTLSKS